MVIGFFACLAAVCLIAEIWMSGRPVQAAPEYTGTTCYTSIQVSEGDTLWSIAEEYRGETYPDHASYMQAVREINHLNGDQIHAGVYLTIPYTEYEAE